MTMLVLFILLTIWLTTAILDYAKYGYIWQLKEYRLLNMRDYLNNGKNRHLIFDYFYFRKRVLRPRFTIKIFLIIVFSFSFESIVLCFWFSWWLVLLLVLLRFIIISIMVGLSYIPTLLIKKIYIYRASIKLEKYKKLIVVGVTGSYGKTTVKEFLAQVLSRKFRVIRTPEYVNTEIGIARFILKTNFINAEIFIVEMGAYKPGDIKIIADMVKPTIGILTAINEQHLALFGNLRKTQTTKYELLYSLPVDGLAVVNSDNYLCREFLDKLVVKNVTFGMNKSHQPDYYITKTQSNKKGSQFDCNAKQYTTSIIGKHNVMNLVPIIAVAKHLGMQINEIQESLTDLELPEKNMQPYLLGSALVINDSHNANPDGFLAALDLMQMFSDDKPTIVITRGMNELGVKSKEKHILVGKKISEIADVLIIISLDHEKYLKEGASRGNIKIKIILDGKKLLQYVKLLSKTNSIILFENRLFNNVEEYIKNKN